MKRLFCSILIILLIAALSTLHVFALKQFTETMIEQLESAELQLSRSQWNSAQELVDSVYDTWEARSFYLHTTLRHTDIDAVRTSLREAKAYLSTREDTAECRALIARLINLLELLLEAELPTIKNLL